MNYLETNHAALTWQETRQENCVQSSLQSHRMSVSSLLYQPTWTV